MEASTPTLSRKRKQPQQQPPLPPNANPFTGILTRRKTQKYFFHQNRSGASRKSPSFPAHLVNHSQCSSQKFAKMSDLMGNVSKGVVDGGDGGDDDDDIYHISIKDLRARRVLPKPPKGDVLAGKKESCKGDCEKSGGEFGGLLVKCVDFEGGLKEGNSNLIGLEICDDSRVYNINEGLIGENPNLIVSEMCDDSRVSCGKEGLIGGNPNLIVSIMCDDSRVSCGKEGLIGGNPNLIVSEMCDDSRVSCGKEGLIGGNPNLIVSEMCEDSRVKFENEGLIGGNPSLIVTEMCDDLRVEEHLVGEDPKMIASERCDYSRAGCEEKGLIGGNPNLSICDSKVDCEVEGSNGRSPNLLICDARVVGKVESSHVSTGDFEDRVLNDMSPNMSSKALQSRSGEQYEEIVQTTPPDAVVLTTPRVDQSVLQNKSAKTSSPPKQISPSKGGSAEGKKSFSNPRRNLGLNPCSRLKLFKTPNSFSYRRLLPFLMDLTKDEPSEPKCNAFVKSETDSEAFSTVSSSQESITAMAKVDEKKPEPVAPCKPLEMNTSTGEDTLSLRAKTSVSSAKEGAPCTPISCPIKNNLENPISDEINLGTPVSNDPEIKGESADGRVVSLDTAGKGKAKDISSIVVVEPTVTLANLKTSAEPSGADGNLNTTPHLSPSVETEHRKAPLEGKPEENSSSVMSSSPKLKALVSSDPTRLGLTRGILKRNPRGCRGICDCLNCASFRLNAEKAFEFSRNQWFEAEELTTDLMRELSSLRSVLEKSVNSANNYAIIPVDQVQEICKRASSAEDIARSRLSQMNEDLHVHCRIKPLQRPRVTFSSNVQEKIIGVTDLAR